MKLNIVSRGFDPNEGYGRYAFYVLKHLARLGVDVHPLLCAQLKLPKYLQRMQNVDLSLHTLSIVPPFDLLPVSGRHWTLTMTEGTKLPDGWNEYLHTTNVERIIVPSEYCRKTFATSNIPTVVVPGGTEASEFPLLRWRKYSQGWPYTFLTIADRGERKGWVEVWQAFYDTFQDNPNVRLIIKTRAEPEGIAARIAVLSNSDTRVQFQCIDEPNIWNTFAQADCIVLPSKSEGWGMIPREAAMMGLPVITIKYSGLDDGHTSEWSLPVAYKLERIPEIQPYIKGEWALADVADLGAKMHWCYQYPQEAQVFGHNASQWLSTHQTWEQSVFKLMEQFQL